MTCETHSDPQRNSGTRGAFVPPATVEATDWDILFALHWDHRCGLSLKKLSCLVSVPQQNLKEWLALLEERGLIVGAEHRPDQELRAVLTFAGRELLDRYLWAAAGLQIGARH